MKTEKEKMLAGELYDASDAHLSAEGRRARDLCKTLNESRDEEQDLRARIVRELFGSAGDAVWIEPPFYCDYSTNITVGDKVFFNFNCVVLDPAAVSIGSNVIFGPAVQIYTASHPISAAGRRTWLELARPIEIGSDVWIGGGAIICPGVRIGSGTVVGAGSVVTRDLPESVLGVGNPCRVIRKLTDQKPGSLRMANKWPNSALASNSRYASTFHGCGSSKHAVLGRRNALSLDLSDDAFDLVLCQQGLQFFQRFVEQTPQC